MTTLVSDVQMLRSVADYMRERGDTLGNMCAADLCNLADRLAALATAPESARKGGQGES